jgi:hypothetical protein
MRQDMVHPLNRRAAQTYLRPDAVRADVRAPALFLAAILEHLDREPAGLAGMLELLDAEVEPPAEDARQPRETLANLGFGEPAPAR